MQFFTQTGIILMLCWREFKVGETTGEHQMVEDSSRVYLQMTKKVSCNWCPRITAIIPCSNKTGPTHSCATNLTSEINIISLENARRVWLIWAMSRLVGSKERQNMPGLGGFVSATGLPPSSKTTIGYYPSIHEPITEYNVVPEILKRHWKSKSGSSTKSHNAHWNISYDNELS